MFLQPAGETEWWVWKSGIEKTKKVIAAVMAVADTVFTSLMASPLQKTYQTMLVCFLFYK
ncbi:hypothetical protein [Bacillus atrophaeus]|uniref:hypothetical protein n=1 Tax=Bacillus atrophaeus TaxID=1452 RepID=UPI002DBA60A9|nr:hypothetical protein [Bacillus atrophaeus]MEC0822918.1 hypothetical protein [Bacillus atrophaeus]